MKDNVKYIDELVKIMDNNELTEIKYKDNLLKIKLKKEFPIPAEYISEVTEEEESPKSIEEIKQVTSIGIGQYFYDSVIKVGDRIKVGQNVGYILIMGVKTPIKSTVNGEIIEILVENGGNVDYGKLLLKVRA